jgi:hypothetical protein
MSMAEAKEGSRNGITRTRKPIFFTFLSLDKNSALCLELGVWSRSTYLPRNKDLGYFLSMVAI